MIYIDSLILIGDSSFSIREISKLPHNRSVKAYFVDETKYTVEYFDCRIYYEEVSNLINDYEICEKEKISFDNPVFITMSSYSFELLREVIIDKSFFNDIIIDNDHGLILPIQQFVNKAKSEPKWNLK